MPEHPDRRPRTSRQQKGDFIRYIGVASTVGINMVVSTFVGFALGYWVVDRYLSSYPWFTIILTLLGIAGGFRYLFRIAQKAGEKSNDQ